MTDFIVRIILKERIFKRRYALALEIGDIYGRVWNNDNGTVEILAQSDKPAKLAKFIQEVRKGPSKWSNVTYVDVTMANFSNYSDFRIAN